MYTGEFDKGEMTGYGQLIVAHENNNLQGYIGNF